MAALETVLAITPKHSLDLINIHNGTIASSITIDAGNMAREPLMIDSEHCIIPKGERQLAIVNIKTGQLKQHWGCPEQLKSMHLSNNKAFFFGGAISGKVYIWHFTTGELLRIFDAHYKGVSQITTNEDDSILLTTGLDGTVHVWNIMQLLDVKELNSVTAGSRLKALAEFSRHSMPITGLIAPAGSVNAGKLYTSSLDRTVIEYCISSKSIRQLWTLPAPVLCMCIHPAQTQLFVGCTNNEIYIIPLYDTTLSPTLASTTTHNTQSNFTSSTSVLSDQPNVQQYIPNNRVYHEPQSNITSNLFGSNQVFPSFVGHTHHITSLSLTLHATHLVSTSLDGSVIIWSIASRQIVKQVNVHRKKHYPISSARVLVDTPASLRVNDEMLRKKQFPLMLRDLRTPLELTNDQNNIRHGTNCFTTVPIVPQFNANFQIFDNLNDELYSNHLLSLIDAENAIADVDGDVFALTTPNTLFQQPKTKNGKRNRIANTANDNSDDDESSDDESDNNNDNDSIKKNKHNNHSSQTNDDDLQTMKQQQIKIESLEAEVKKWKTTATKLYKQAK